MEFKRFKSKLLFFLITILMISFSGILIAIDRVVYQEARAKAEKDLLNSARNFKKIVEIKTSEIKAKGKLPASDFAFKSVLGTYDKETILSSFKSYQGRTGADFMAVVYLDEDITVSSIKGERKNECEEKLRSIDFEELEEIDSFSISLDKTYQVVVIPIEAPLHLANLIIGFEIGNEFVKDLSESSRLQVTVLNRKKLEESWKIIASTLEKDTAKGLLSHLDSQFNEHSEKLFSLLNSAFTFTIKDIEFASYQVPLETLAPEKARILLQRNLTAEIAYISRLRLVLLTIFVIALLAALAIATKVAKAVSSPIEQMSDAAQKISSGDFDISIKTRSRDEIGLLSQTFNKMASEIQSMLKMSIEKARQDTELETARLMQSMLMPKQGFSNREYTLGGVSVPASECGGDIWHHTITDDRFLKIWIADVTGHGVGAALTTAAIRAIISSTERTHQNDPVAQIKMIDEVIFDVSKGEKVLTLFFAKIDLKTGDLEYINASHDPPFMISFEKSEETPELIPLSEISGPHLGKGLRNDYKIFKSYMPSKSWFLMYTDGVKELMNSKEIQFGQRRLIKSLTSSVADIPPPETAIYRIHEDLDQFRGEIAYDDDVTMIILHRNDKALKNVRKAS